MNKFLLFLISFLLFTTTILIAYEITIHTITLTSNQQQVFNFLLNNRPLPMEYNESEVSHFADVKIIMDYIPSIIFFLIVFLGIIIIYLKFYSKENILELLSNASQLAIILSLIFAIFALALFPTIFTYFHYLLFPQGNWIFPENSFIITTFPQSFFQSIAVQIGITTILLELIAPITNVLIKRNMKNKKH